MTAAPFMQSLSPMHYDTIPTITLSNRPGAAGSHLLDKEAFSHESAEDVAKLFAALHTNGLSSTYDLVLTGYTNTASVLEEVATGVERLLQSRGQNAGEMSAVYICDPVLGDGGRFYVDEPEAILDIYREKILRMATLITPNGFEATRLLGRATGDNSIRSREDALAACVSLQKLSGGAAVLITGLDLDYGQYLQKWSDHLEDAIPLWTQACDVWEGSDRHGGTCAASTSRGTRVQTIAYLSRDGVTGLVHCPTVENTFAGGGDLFTGLLARTMAQAKDGGRDMLTGEAMGVLVQRTASTMYDVLSMSSTTPARTSTTPTAAQDIDVLAAASILRESSAVPWTSSAAHRPATIQRMPRPSVVDVTTPRTTAATTVATDGDKTQAGGDVGAGICVKGVIFDMDGTLTEPGAIDFKEMYARTGLDPKGGDILTQVATGGFTQERKAELMRLIEDVEVEANTVMVLQPGVSEALHYLACRGIPVAISTRNCMKGVTRLMALLDDDFEKKGLGPVPRGLFAPVVTRACLSGVNKPSGQVAGAVLASWGMDPDEGPNCVFVGDSGDDVKAGQNAGLRTVLVTNGEEWPSKGETARIQNMADFIGTLQGFA